MIIHDLRSPILGISGNLELLKMDPGNTEPYIANVHYAVSNIIEQVNSILEVNRLEHGNIRINLNQDNLKDIVLEAIELLGAVKSKCAIHVVCTSEPVMAFCDKNLIRRVILNLLSNAVKFTAGGGSIQIEIIAEEKGIRVRVADAGPGIPVHYHKKIFEKFGRVDTKENRAAYSIGLGLAFCKLAIEAHGGEIGVDSEEGEGSTFWFFLPNGSGECPVILFAQQ